MKKSLLRLKSAPYFSGLMIFLFIFALNVVIQTPEKFFYVNNINTIIAKNTPLILITMSQGLLMMSGVVDFSVGAQVSLGNVIAIMLPQTFGTPLWVSWVLAVLACVAVSLFNGLITTYLRIPVLLSCYAMVFVVKGLNVLIMPKPQGTVPSYIYKTYDSLLLGFLPFSALILAGVLLFWVYLKRTRFGRALYATGGNLRHAYSSGVNTSATRMKTYLIAGVINGIAGLCMTAMTASGDPNAGEVYGLKTVAACILGGIALSGGWGSLSCAFFGALILVLTQNGVSQTFNLLCRRIPGFSVTTYWQNFASDMIILLALVLTVFANRAMMNSIKQQIKYLALREEKKDAD